LFLPTPAPTNKHSTFLKASGKPQVIVRDLPHARGRGVQRGHITRDILFSQDGRQMFVSVGSASNVAEKITKRDAATIARWEKEHGLGSAPDDETDRAAVLAFDPDGKNRRVYASGLRNCVGMAAHPQTGDIWCSVNERDELGDDLVPDFFTRIRDGSFVLSSVALVLHRRKRGSASSRRAPGSQG
jgi:glucose/arabinose dehydrogenase